MMNTTFIWNLTSCLTSQIVYFFGGWTIFFLESGTVGKKAMVSNSSGFRTIEKHP